MSGGLLTDTASKYASKGMEINQKTKQYGNVTRDIT